jgi:ATP-dependent exoDNAse (exonuclease V) alpha subunit
LPGAADSRPAPIGEGALAASRRLNGPTLKAGERVFQAGDRILCRKNQNRLDVVNGDLGTILSVDPKQMTLTVRRDRDPETRELPSWYLDQVTKFVTDH